MNSLFRIILGSVAVVLAFIAVALTYEGFEGAFFNRGYLWAVPIGLSFVTIALLLWTEEQRAREVEAARAKRDAERLRDNRKQEPFGSSPDDTVI